jgi:TrmH family RNA methyltransferase
VDYRGVDYSKGAALVVGAEQYGLSGFWKENADARVAIPMRGRVVDSLNVATAAAVLIFHAVGSRTEG